MAELQERAYMLRHYVILWRAFRSCSACHSRYHDGLISALVEEAPLPWTAESCGASSTRRLWSAEACALPVL